MDQAGDFADLEVDGLQELAALASLGPVGRLERQLVVLLAEKKEINFGTDFKINQLN
jgi:hypothetical protein